MLQLNTDVVRIITEKGLRLEISRMDLVDVFSSDHPLAPNNKHPEPGADKVLKSNSKAVPDEGKDGVLSMLTSVLSSSGAKEEAKKPVKQNSKVLPKKSIREALPPSPYCEAEVRDFLIATKLECKKLFNNYKRTKVVAGNNRTTRYFTCTLVLDT